ncbi:MAG: hypothetical protein RID07_06450 [Lacipirellulaceae bacterium]
MLNILRGPDDFCRSILAGYRYDFDRTIARESRQEPPSGAMTSAYSPELWNRYWNDRIHQMWEIGPDNCDGTYQGPPGPEVLEYAIEQRRLAGLPEIRLDERNVGKSL